MLAKGGAPVRDESESGESSSVGALMEVAKAEKSAEKRLDQALLQVSQSIDVVSSHVMQQVDEEDEEDVQRLFESLTIQTVRHMRSLGDAQEESLRERLKLQTKLFDARMETMRKAAEVAMRNREAELRAEFNRELAEQAKRLLAGGDQILLDLTETVEMLRKQLAEELEESRALRDRLEFMTKAMEENESARKLAERKCAKAEAAAEKALKELAAQREANTALMNRNAELEAAAVHVNAAQAKADEAQAKADKQLKMAKGMIDKVQAQLKDAWAEQLRLRKELEAARAAIIEARREGEQNAAMINADNAEMVANYKSLEASLQASRAEVQALNETLQATDAKLESANEKADAANQEALGLGVELRTKRQELHKARVEVDELTTKCYKTEQQKGELTRQHAQVRAENERLRGSSAEALSEEVDRLTAELSRAREAVDTIMSGVDGQRKELADTALAALRQLGSHLTYTLTGARSRGDNPLTIVSLTKTHSLPSISPRIDTGYKRKTSPKRHWPVTDASLPAPERRSEMLMRVESEVARRNITSGGMLDQGTLDTSITFAEAMTMNALSRCKRLMGPGSIRTASRGGGRQPNVVDTGEQPQVRHETHVVSRGALASRGNISSRGSLVSRNGGNHSGRNANKNVQWPLGS